MADMLKHTQEIAHIGSWEYDTRDRTFLWSEHMYRLLGLRPGTETLPLERACEFFHPDDRERVWKDVAALIETGKPLENELRFITVDGRTRVFFSRAIPLRDPSGRVHRIRGISRDVTAERESHRALRESEERHRLLINSLHDHAIITLDPSGHVTSWSASAERIKGYRPAEILGRHFSCFYPPEDIVSEKPLRNLQQALSNGRIEDEGWRIRKDGTRFWADVILTSLRDPDGEHKGFAKITRDFSDRRKIEEELQKRQALLAQAEKLAKIGSWETVLSTGEFYWSAQLYQILGFDPLQTTPSFDLLSQIIHVEDREIILRETQRAIVSRHAVEYEVRCSFPGGMEKVLFTRAIPLYSESGQPLRLIGTTEDVTERRHRQHELRRLSQQLLNVRDEEQRRVARDLHETSSQSMAAIKMVLGRVVGMIPEASSAPRKLIQYASDIVDEVIGQVRTISHLLHPPLLDEAGLGPALRWYARGFAERSGVSTLVEMDNDFGRLLQEIELAVFRIVQEALTNVHRHSGSRDVIIRLRRAEDTVTVEIEDHGRGIALQPAVSGWRPPLGVGTAGMRERVTQLNGTFEIRSSPGNGTTVSAVFPLSQP